MSLEQRNKELQQKVLSARLRNKELLDELEKVTAENARLMEEHSRLLVKYEEAQKKYYYQAMHLRHSELAKKQNERSEQSRRRWDVGQNAYIGYNKETN